jgi:hypothetical protein
VALAEPLERRLNRRGILDLTADGERDMPHVLGLMRKGDDA